MGNDQTKPINKKRNQSFDIGDFKAFDKILPNQYPQSSLDLKASLSNTSLQPKMKNSTSMHQMPSISNPSNLKPKISIKQQNARLERLTKTNDDLRKQLMEINKKLAEQLQKKKMPTLMPSHMQKNAQKTTKLRSNSTGKSQEPTLKDKYKAQAIKKQLQNAYSQVQMYKKQIQLLKKNDSHENDMKLQTSEDKVSAIQAEISNVQKSLQSIRGIVGKQKGDIEGFERELQSEEMQECKREIVMLKERLKKIKDISRKKEKQQKVRHQLLIQMERKVRQLNEEYVPELRNWAAQDPTTKSRIVGQSNSKPLNPKKKQISPSSEKPFRYLPSKLELEEAQNHLKQQKQIHEQFHKKIDTELKKRNDFRDERTRIQNELQILYKNLEGLQYKKERYIQLIMGNISVGGDGVDQLLSIGEEEGAMDGDVVAKGENLPNQVEFTDTKAIPNSQSVIHKLKIITIHVWTTEKGHITALQFYYTDGDGFFVGKKSAEPTVPTEKHTLQLSEGDYLRNVMGIFNSKNKFLQFIVFQSFKGKVLKAGKQSFKNTNFNLRIGKGQRPAMVSGANVQDSGIWRINRLDFVVKAS